MFTLETNSHWQLLAPKALNGEQLTLEEGLSVLEADNTEILPLMQAAFQKSDTIITAKSKAEYDYQRQERAMSRRLRLLLPIDCFHGSRQKVYIAGQRNTARRCS